MDVVLALTLEWQDPRLTWDPYAWGNTRISEVWIYDFYANQSDVFKLTVKPDEIWTPSIDVANRIHDYSPTTERTMMSTIDYKGTIFILLTYFQFQNF